MSKPTPPNDARLRLFVFLILLAGYLLVYINTPDSADGDAALAQAASMMRYGAFDIATIGAQDAIFHDDAARMGVFGVDGVYHSKKGLTRSIGLLPLVFAAQFAPWLPLRATAMLFNPLITALTGALLYTLARETGFRPRTAMTVAILFGFGSTAVVYTKTLFGESLAALLVVIAVMYAVRYRHTFRMHTLLISGGAVGFASGVNLTYVLPGLLIGLYLIGARVAHDLNQSNHTKITRLLATSITYATPIFVCLLILGTYNAMRFGSPLDTGYYLGEGENFDRPFLLGIFGLTFSPYRGLLWYTPLALLALPGAWLLARGQRRLTWLVLALIGAQFATYASWWSWHGGVVWGPRFILPVLPLIVLCAAPIIERSFIQPTLRLLVFPLAALSIGVQLPGILLSPYPFYGVLSERYGTGDMSAVVATLRDNVLTDVSANAIIGHLELLAQGTAFDPMWLRGDWLVALCALALAGVAFWVLSSGPIRSVSASLLTSLLVLNLVPASQLDDPSVESARRLEDALHIDAPLLVASNHYGSALLDIESRPVLSMTAPTAPSDPLAAPMWQYAQTLDSRLWYVTWFPPADPRNWIERWLWENASFGEALAVDGHRALLFDFAAADPGTEVNWRFGNIRLRRYGITEQSGDLWVTLDWESAEQSTDDYQFFVHVLDAQGGILAQQDRAPMGGYHPSASWQPGEIVHERLYFPNAHGATAVRIGWVDPTSQERLPVFNAEDARQHDDYILIPISQE